MRRISMACLAAASALCGQDYVKREVQTLYLHSQLDAGLGLRDPAVAGKFQQRRPHHGFAFSYVENGSRISGLKVEVSWLWDKAQVRTAAAGFSYTQEPLWLLAGSQFKNNKPEARWKPFFHVLGGVARFRTFTSWRDLTQCAAAFGAATCPARFNGNRWSFVTVAGGGLDVRLRSRLDFRLIHADYAPLSRFGSTMHNVRFGAGVVFH